VEPRVYWLIDSALRKFFIKNFLPLPWLAKLDAARVKQVSSHGVKLKGMPMKTWWSDRFSDAGWLKVRANQVVEELALADTRLSNQSEVV
jgi:hypothetical protein